MYSNIFNSLIQANLSFTSINTQVSQLYIKSGKFVVRSTSNKTTKVALKASNIPNQITNTINILLQLPKNEASIQTD